LSLLSKLQNLPQSPGIYQYFDTNGKLLYIGKAKVLKNRVKSYFRFTPKLQPSSKLGPRIYKMICEVADLHYIVVESESDALILENSLIKQLKPKYNILLRDDKTYPYIYVDTSEDYPRLDITRKILKKRSIRYFGPFSSGARAILDSIYEIFPLVQKKSCAKGSKACIFYEIKKCLAPCEGKVTQEQYHDILDEAISYINNKEKIIELLHQKIILYSEQLRFEEAMQLRDRIQSIEKSQLKSTIDFAKDEDFDLFGALMDGNKGVVIKMFIRGGKIVSTVHNYLNTTDITSYDEIYKMAIINYYNNELPTIPKNIYIADEIDNTEELEEFLMNRYHKNISISLPKRGLKKQLLATAKANCTELLKLDKNTTNYTLFSSIKELFNLDKLSTRFECFDNSQMMGQAKVGSMVIFDGNQFIKDDYRLYNLEANDEYAQMKEMLSRRVERFQENPPPDMWIIDGGKALLDLASNILMSVGVDIDVIAISKEKVDAKAYRAKGKAKDILYFKDEKLKLETSDKRLHFFQKLRDEAHRTAINFHKRQKRKEDKQISLLQVHGIGEAKIKKLLDFFGTFEKISTASKEQICKILNENDAKKLLEHLNKRD
jgi:excinuclease ABC subunit C